MRQLHGIIQYLPYRPWLFAEYLDPTEISTRSFPSEHMLGRPNGQALSRIAQPKAENSSLFFRKAHLRGQQCPHDTTDIRDPYTAMTGMGDPFNRPRDTTKEVQRLLEFKIAHGVRLPLSIECLCELYIFTRQAHERITIKKVHFRRSA